MRHVDTLSAFSAESLHLPPTISLRDRAVTASAAYDFKSDKIAQTIMNLAWL